MIHNPITPSCSVPTNKIQWNIAMLNRASNDLKTGQDTSRNRFLDARHDYNKSRSSRIV